MKHIIAAIALRLLGCRLAANHADEPLLANAADGGSPFAILQQDGFLIPYGEFPHRQGLQLFDRQAAEEMVTAHNSLLGRMVRWARGAGASYPVYIGHPDLPGSKDADKRAYGWIEEMSAENDGLRLQVKWSPAGRELVENAHYKFYSPLWYFRKVKGGIRPVALKSMGLTNDPNIPVPALANEYAEGEEEEASVTVTATAAESEGDDKGEGTMASEGQSKGEGEGEGESETAVVVPMEILAALGMEEGDLAAVLAKLADLKQAADAKDAAETSASTADAARTEAENQLSTVQARATDLEGRLRHAAANAVQVAVLSGRIAPADVDQRVSDLVAANDFPTALADLAKLPVKFKTESRTGDLGGAKARVVLAANDGAAAAREERARLVANEFEATDPSRSIGERKRMAWRKAQAKRPDLFTKGSSGAEA